ncbi:MAG TPA: M1 family aminopeptidase [Terriglobales bacterium]|nr:M1 family aminopeptidase [Terriglobales bacterium]
MAPRIVFAAVILLASVSLYAADNPPAAPNSDPTYQQLRNLALGGEAVSVNNFDLKRDAGTFHLHSGTVCFVTPVQGKVTGAVFTGDGNFVFNPPSESERKSLKLLTKEDQFNENFSQAVLRFTDSTYDDIKKGGSAASGGCDAGLLKDSQNTTRHKLKFNLEARILQEVLSPEPRGLFVAFIHGKHYSGKELYQIDPDSGSEQVSFTTYDDNKSGEWAAFNISADHSQDGTGKPFRIEHQHLDATFERSGKLLGKATTDLVARRKGLRVVSFDLFPSLRVQSVTANGRALSFIQEGKNDDGDFLVILPKALAESEKLSLTTTYEGKDAVVNTGGGNYFPVARDNWYPNDPEGDMGEFALYDMTLRIPKGMKMAATGVLVSENNEAGQNVTVWKSETPQTVAGFSFGLFKEEQAKLTKPEYFIQSYANESSPDWVEAMKGGPAMGMMSTTSLNKKALAEGEMAVQLYTEYFGPSLFKHMQLTQQTACNFGQSWPELVWIPICYYFDTTVHHQLGLDWGDRGYWKVVTPHEVAHQWWGHTVGFASGRDQWMSEGFADMSASLYISMVEKNPKKFIEFWNDERTTLLERNAQGFRAIDVGPLTMGYRASNSRTGFDVTQRLIYPKGAYVLHMIRMMLWDRKTGDQNFKAAMQDFVKTYSGKAATTEDFKAMMEKHMTPEMDLEGNHRLDWFFNEYVYGTALPTYKIDSTFEKDTSGDVVFGFKITQSGVDDKFRMIVPIYLELADGRIVSLGRARLTGNTSVDQKVPLKGLKDTPKPALLNYNDDVLASN